MVRADTSIPTFYYVIKGWDAGVRPNHAMLMCW